MEAEVDQMYAPLYCRLCGWLCTALGLVGMIQGQVNGYMTITWQESTIYLAAGVLSMSAARARHRTAVLTALVCGLVLFFWGMCGMAWPDLPVTGGDPLENAIRIVIGAWGLYVSVGDVLAWRSRNKPIET